MNIIQQKFYPDTKCDIWSYCAYLGSIETSYKKFDLGLWRSQDAKNFSVTSVEGDRYDDYQSVGIIHDNQFMSHILNKKFGDALPVRENTVLALQHEWLKDNIFSFMDLSKYNYIVDNKIDYLVRAEKSHNLVGILNDQKTRVNLELHVNEETHWKNAFYVDNQIFDYDDIYMLEVPYEQ